jgi:hypothetical protein
MTPHRKSIQFMGVPLAILITFGPQAAFPHADHAAQMPATGQIWRVTYVSGDISEARGKKHKMVPLPQGAKLKVKAESDVIEFESKHGRVLSISASAVTGITYDHPTHRVSRAVLAQLGDLSGCGGGPGAYGCAAFMMGDLVVAATTLPFRYTNHYVRLTWQEQQEEHAIEFKVDKRHYLPLLSQLQSVTGINLRDLTQEMKSVHQALRGTEACKSPDLASNDISIPLGGFASMQNDLNSAGACGFRLSGFGSAQSAALTASLHKDGSPYQYRLVRAIRPSKIQEGLNRAGAEGYRLCLCGLALNTLPPIMFLEKPPASANEKFEYLYFRGSSETKLREKAEKAMQEGYQVIVQKPTSAGHTIIFERSARGGS